MAFAISPGRSLEIELVAELSQTSWLCERLGLVSLASKALLQKHSVPNF